MKTIVLHDRYSNEPIILRIAAINSLMRKKDSEVNEEYSEVLVGSIFFAVKDPIDVIMKKIKTAKQMKEIRNDTDRYGNA